jgi:hypothetical protein
MQALGATALFAMPFIYAGKAQVLGARPNLHAMIVGINTYTGSIGRGRGGSRTVSKIRQLKGCINDASVIETALRPLATTMRTLKDREATRSRFLASWREMSVRAAPGDTLLLTYAGHGGQETTPSGERVETLIFSGFDDGQPWGGADRIINHEMKELFRSALARMQTVIFVADARWVHTSY